MTELSGKCFFSQIEDWRILYQLDARKTQSSARSSALTIATELSGKVLS